MFVTLPLGLLDEFGIKEWRGLPRDPRFPFSDTRDVLEPVNGTRLFLGLLLCPPSATNEFRGLRGGGSGSNEWREL